MSISREPQHKFRKLLLFSHMVEGCPYKAGGKSKKKGFDEVTLVEFLVHKAFKISIPKKTDAIFNSGVIVSKKDTMTGDLAFFTRGTNEDQKESFIGLIIGQIEKQIIYSSKEKKRVVIEDFTRQIGEYKLQSCIKLFERE